MGYELFTWIFKISHPVLQWVRAKVQFVYSNEVSLKWMSTLSDLYWAKLYETEQRESQMTKFKNYNTRKYLGPTAETELNAAFSPAQNRRVLRPFVFRSALLFFPAPLCFISWFSIQRLNLLNFLSYFGTQTRFKLSANVKSSLERVRDELEWICNWYCQRYLSWWEHCQHKLDHDVFLFSIQTSVGNKNRAQLLIIFQTETAININRINREAKRRSTESDCHRSHFAPSRRRQYLCWLLNSNEKDSVTCSLCNKFKTVGANGKNVILLKDTQRSV